MKSANKKPFLTQTVLCGLAYFLAFACVYAQKSQVRTDAGDVQVKTVVENLTHPWGMAFLPDNRLLVTERAGQLRILDSGQHAF